MEFQICTGKYETFGVTKEQDILSFSLQAGEEADCNLLLYSKEQEDVYRIAMERNPIYPGVYTVGIRGLDWRKYDYNFEIDGIEQPDTYAGKIIGREIWAEEERRFQENGEEHFVPEKIKKQRKELYKSKQNKIKSSFYFSDFSWKNQKNPRIPKEDMVIYKLHARGFSMGMKTKNPEKGTFEMIERKLKYFKDLGVTSLLFLPIYEFEEVLRMDHSRQEKTSANLLNYWGYTRGNYFAPKASYLGKENNPDILKKLIMKMHQIGMEFLMEFYFDEKVNPHLIIDAIRYWKREYHVDGFRIISSQAVAELLAEDPLLTGSKLFFEGFSEAFAKDKERIGPELYTYNDGFLYAARKMLNHQGGSIYDFVCQMKRQQANQGFVNYVAENNGFTLWDVFSYDRKHNEANQEDNRDGIEWNCSCNSGQEGNSRKKEINRLRQQQVRNALAVTVFSQGIPLIWMGDEDLNTQSGNNNAYCQDNETGWKDWKNTGASHEMREYLKAILKIRKEYPVLRNTKPYQMTDYKKKGYPDLSYHSEEAWRMNFEQDRRFAGMFYCGGYGGTQHLYIAYNFQTIPQKLALPEKIAWQILMDTCQEEREEKVIENELIAAPRSVVVLTGREMEKSVKKEKMEKKNEKVPNRN